MNILIILNSVTDPLRGGVERVYSNLAQEFRKRGYNIYAYYFESSDYDNNHCYTDIYKAKSKRNRRKNAQELKKAVNLWDIDIIICANPEAAIMHASMDTGKRVFIHVHNVPSILMHGQMGVFCKYNINNKISRLLSHWRMKIKFDSVFNRIKRNNGRIVLLSESFRKDFHSFSTLPDKYIVSIANPFIIDNAFDIENCMQRNKELLFVGRMSESHKYISSLLRIWKILQKKLPNWNLTIVGGGEQLSYFKEMAVKIGLERYSFENFQNPIEYYKRSSSLLMTSKFEGFSMVLVEAMQYGCVPFAYHSFVSLPDIIDDDINGFMIKPFDEDQYIERVISFVSMPFNKQCEMRRAAVTKANIFSVDKIVDKWLHLFEE